ncbi:MAG: Glu-tRNA(Gln) amidotransferase subunit GatE [Nanoarchaeota archaeon]|nr:Glu-tRNA(Gln) amidotransferase subunit GatE [Nanoarchaeota archaeon]MBU1027656.1 Glu-tRNA(Gln) amidotransferase subunit GatE [Nanoarchaeota archaeon]
MLDYKELGFKSGLEIHQQLDSHKLFCNCPFLLRQDEPDFEISRRLHAVAGEKGEIDVATSHEASLNKEFVYQGYDTTCLVELDEEPPHLINQEALKIALHISLLLNCKIIPISQIMRKTVIDGSNTSGFQRTVMISRDGYVETSNGKVGINFILLEEDAARIIKDGGSKKIYRLDRLGGPMVEVVTAPDIVDSEHAKETALKIGEILRSCKVKRGIGTIRQDINISIKGHERAEIKGFQDPKVFVEVVEKEVQRQSGNLQNKKKSKPEVRGANPDNTTTFLRPLPGSARMYPETDLPLLKISKQMIDEAKKTLPKLREELEKELRKQGLNEEYIKLLFKLNKVNGYKEAYYNLPKPNLIANLLLVFPKDLAKKKKLDVKDVSEIIDEYILGVINFVNKKRIKEEDMKQVFENLVDGKSLEDSIKIERVDVSDIEEKIHNIIKSKPGLSANAYMGLVMKEFQGKVDGKEVMTIIKKYI